MTIVKQSRGETVECPTCGQKASADAITALAQAREAEWLHREYVWTEHSSRFRQLGGMLYPRQVSLAYDGDRERAAADSDEQVATAVAAWERELELEPVNWPALGQSSKRRRSGTTPTSSCRSDERPSG
jgi:hypothetical protein